MSMKFAIAFVSLVLFASLDGVTQLFILVALGLYAWSVKGRVNVWFIAAIVGSVMLFPFAKVVILAVVVGFVVKAWLKVQRVSPIRKHTNVVRLAHYRKSR